MTANGDNTSGGRTGNANVEWDELYYTSQADKARNGSVKDEEGEYNFVRDAAKVWTQGYLERCWDECVGDFEDPISIV